MLLIRLKVELKAVPVKDIKFLNMLFPIPDVTEHYDCKVCFYIFLFTCLTLIKCTVDSEISQTFSQGAGVQNRSILHNFQKSAKSQTVVDKYCWNGNSTRHSCLASRFVDSFGLFYLPKQPRNCPWDQWLEGLSSSIAVLCQILGWLLSFLCGLHEVCSHIMAWSDLFVCPRESSTCHVVS